jgi:hypothetical protein
MLTARIMTDNTPRRGLETPIDPEQGPGVTTGGFMDMILRRSPFATGVMTRAGWREHSGWTLWTIDPPLGQATGGGSDDRVRDGHGTFTS